MMDPEIEKRTAAFKVQLGAYANQFPDEIEVLDKEKNQTQMLAWRRWMQFKRLKTRLLDQALAGRRVYTVPCKWPWDLDPQWLPRDIEPTNEERDVMSGIAHKDAIARRLDAESVQRGKEIIQSWADDLGIDRSLPIGDIYKQARAAGIGGFSIKEIEA